MKLLRDFFGDAGPVLGFVLLVGVAQAIDAARHTAYETIGVTILVSWLVACRVKMRFAPRLFAIKLRRWTWRLKHERGMRKLYEKDREHWHDEADRLLGLVIEIGRAPTTAETRQIVMKKLGRKRSTTPDRSLS